MRHFKHYCKLIFSTIAVVLVFACHSLVAHADPLSAAMLAGGLADGFIYSGFAGLSADSVSSIVQLAYSDLVPWDDIVLAGKAYLTIRDLVGSNNVEIELSPEISSGGYDRLTQFNTAYNLSPGAYHDFGSYYALGDYVFDSKVGPTSYRRSAGPIIGVIPSSNFQFSASSFDNISGTISGSNFTVAASVGSGSDTNTQPISSSLGLQLRLCLDRAQSVPRFQYGYFNQYGWVNFSGLVSPQSSVTVSSYSPSVSRDSTSVITDPDGLSNKIVLPSSYINDISYTSGDTINTEQVVIDVLNDILDAISANAVVESTYSDSPAPPSSETISETPYTTLDDTFTEFKEFFGDIYDGIIDFKESFGDWVDNVASGWTEVFGDIYSDLHEFKESFGDWVDDIASGWTEIFGDIYSTVSGIASTVSGTIANTLSAISSAVQSLVQTIENADFNFVDAFWKNFLTPFNNLFNTIKSHLSIWHYVVEWLSSISSVFTFYLGVFSGAGSGYLLPIYACFAGTVVIAVYKRFGK